MKFVPLNQTYYYNEYVSDASMLNIAYPDMIHSEIIGTTYTNRSILMFRVGKGKKGILLTGGVHGRESINPIVLMAMMEYYARAIQSEEECHVLLNKFGISLKDFFEEYSFYVLPMVNPDGYMVALRGYNIIPNEEYRLMAKGSGITYKEWKYNARGIDINRNFPSKSWKQKFPGDYPASEQETKALIRVFDEIDSVAYVDYHSRGKVIYYYRNGLSPSYNTKQFEIATKLQKLTGYELVPPEEEIEVGDSGGNTVHFYSERYQKPAITIETVVDGANFPLKERYQISTYHEILYTPLFVV